MTPSCHCHDNTYAPGTVLIKIKIEQGSFTPNDLMERVENHLYSEQAPLSHFKGLQMGIFSFPQNETGAKSVTMAAT